MKNIQVFASRNAAVDFPGDCLAIHLVHRGRASVVQGQQSHPLIEDAFLIQNVGTPHRIVASDDSVITFCIPEFLVGNERFAECLTPHELGVNIALSGLVRSPYSDRGVWEVNLVQSLLAARDKSNQQFYLTQTLSADPVRNSEMISAREFILTQLDRPLTLEQIADHIGYSSFHFHRIFTESHGVTPGRYILTEKIRRACRKLVLTHSSVATIAEDCGFYSSTSFASTFKKGTGYRPTGFRDMASHYRQELAFFAV